MKRDTPPTYTDSVSASTNDIDHHSDTSSVSDLNDGTHTPSDASTISSTEHGSPSPPAYNPTAEPSFFEQDHKQSYTHQTNENPRVFNNLRTSTRSEDTCCILNHLPAVWTTKVTSGMEVKLSTLAAGVLIKSGRVEEKDLYLYVNLFSSIQNSKLNSPFPFRYTPRPSSSGPTDPISGALIATHTIVSGVVKGVADYPILLTKSIRNATTPVQFGKQFAPLNPEGPKGVSRIVGSALMAPMDVTLNMARGFENLPSVWGDEGRKAERGEVKGVKDGFVAAGKVSLLRPIFSLVKEVIANLVLFGDRDLDMVSTTASQVSQHNHFMVCKRARKKVVVCGVVFGEV